MKAIYVYDDAIDLDADLSAIGHGITKKVMMQLKAFQDLGVDMLLWSPQAKTGIPKWKKALGLLPFMPIHTTWQTPEQVFAGCDFVYIRKSFMDGFFIRFLKRLKKSHPEMTILLEIPTYPYDEEFTGLVRKLQLQKEKIWREKLKGLIDFIVTFSEHDQILGIPTIKTQNGIDVEAIAPLHPKEDDRKLRLIAVAIFSKWHGYDRLIKGLAEYYQKPFTREIDLILVGDGPEKASYEKLVQENQLEKQVHFTGRKSGEELEALYHQSDLAIATLGLHRIGLEQVSTLKAREYCARGIPFIKAYKDLSFPENYPYVMDVAAGDEAVDMDAVLAFQQAIENRGNRTLVVEEMRSFATEHLSWKSQLSIVVETLRALNRIKETK